LKNNEIYKSYHFRDILLNMDFIDILRKHDKLNTENGRIYDLNQLFKYIYEVQESDFILKKQLFDNSIKIDELDSRLNELKEFFKKKTLFIYEDAWKDYLKFKEKRGFNIKKIKKKKKNFGRINGNSRKFKTFINK